MASRAAGTLQLPSPNSVMETAKLGSGDHHQITLEELSKRANKDRRRSLSSVSGYLENPSRDYSFSSEPLNRCSSLSVLAETPEGKEGNTSRRWTVPWRWSRMRKAHRRKTDKVMGRRSCDRLNPGFSTFSSENFSREEIATVIKDKLFVSGSVNSSLTANGGEDANSGTSLSLKYQPKVFPDIAGHEIIVRAIRSAIQRKRISSLYLFHGPSGTGKSSAARILAMALNCESSIPTRPCWSCRGCNRSLYAMEMCSGSRLAGFEKVKTLIQSTSFMQAIPGPKAFIIEECHLLTVGAWDELLSTVEGANGSTLVFILITTEAEGLPISISSRCQKYCFPKLKDEDIELKLTRIANGEGITLEREALRLIIAKAEGSLREAENILDQLTLLDRRISTSMVQQIVHLIPRQKLNDLLMAMLSGDTMKTIRFTTELIRSGVESQALISQLASLVKDLLSATAIAASGSSSAASVNGPSEKLCYALKVLVEVEKQSGSLVDHSTQTFAALLQIASQDAPTRISSRNSMTRDERVPNAKGDEANPESLEVERLAQNKISGHPSHNSSIEDDGTKNYTTMKIPDESERYRGKAVHKGTQSTSIGDIEEIWLNVVERIQSPDIKEFLRHQVKLASMTISSANAIVHLLFKNPEDKMKAEMSEESLSRALQSSVGCSVTINMSMQPLDLQAAPHQDNIRRTGFGAAPVKHCSASSVPSPQSGLIALARYNSLREKGRPSVSAERKLYVSELLSQDKQLDDEPGTNRPAPPAGTRSLRIESPKHRWLSLSSIQQSDASVETYSQDILFEKANKDRENKARRNPKLQKSFTNLPEEHHAHDATKIEGLDHSWRCKDIFCQQKEKGKSH